MSNVRKTIQFSFDLEANTKKGFYHLKNTKTGDIFSFTDCDRYINACEALRSLVSLEENVLVKFSMVVTMQRLAEIDENIIITAPLPLTDYVMWKGDWKTGQYVNSDLKGMSRRAPRKEFYFIDLKDRSITKWNSYRKVSDYIGTSVSAVAQAARSGRPFNKNRFVVTMTHDEAQKILQKYKAPVVGAFRRITEIVVRDITSLHERSFSTVKEMAGFYGIKYATLSCKISSYRRSLNQDEHAFRKVPLHDNLVFYVIFE